MKIGIISDIHANYEALISLKGILDKCDRIICLGDMVGYYCQVNEVIDFLRDMDAICVLGNHDYYLLNGCPDNVPKGVRFGIDFAKKAIRMDNYGWLSKLPTITGRYIDGRSLLIVHGSPWNPIGDYLYKDNPILHNLDDFKFDIIAFGQTHRRLILTESGKVQLLNPGSVGQSRDITSTACALVLDTKTMDVENIAETYDPSKVINLAINNGAQDWIYKHFD